MGRRRRPSNHQARLGIGHLSGRLAPHLARPLHNQGQPVNETLGQIPSAGVQWEIAIGPLDSAPFDERSALSSLAEPKVLDRHQYLTGKVLVELGDVDVGGSKAGPPVQRLGHFTSPAEVQRVSGHRDRSRPSDAPLPKAAPVM